MKDVQLVDTNKVEKSKQVVVEKIHGALDSQSYGDAFMLIFTNNAKGCLINIAGGAFLGIVTLFSLCFNGFVTSDVIVNSYQMGIPLMSILRMTLPHSFELIGFWLSGAIGFFITWKLIQYMCSKEEITLRFFKQIGVYMIVVFIIILCAAYVEAYITIKMLK